VATRRRWPGGEGKARIFTSRAGVLVVNYRDTCRGKYAGSSFGCRNKESGAMGKGKRGTGGRGKGKGNIPEKDQVVGGQRIKGEYWRH